MLRNGLQYGAEKLQSLRAAFFKLYFIGYILGKLQCIEGTESLQQPLVHIFRTIILADVILVLLIVILDVQLEQREDRLLISQEGTVRYNIVQAILLRFDGEVIVNLIQRSRFFQ
ncbi:hypothetical protein D3C86_1296100 [compost metagenome]